MLGLISKGIVIGVLVSAPMGPIGMLCIQRTLNKGRWHGFVTGLGAALSDVIYAALTCLGMGVVVNFVEANQAPLQLIGSIVLGIFGYYIFQSNPVRNLRKQREKKLSFTQDFITAFLLTFSNVLIVLLYIGLFARFGFVLPEHSVWARPSIMRIASFISSTDMLSSMIISAPREVTNSAFVIFTSIGVTVPIVSAASTLPSLSAMDCNNSFL